MARPSKLTPENGWAYVEALQAGSSRKAAATIAGVSELTVAHWLKRGMRGEQPYDVFAEHVERIEREHKSARQGKFSDLRVERIVKSIRAGMPRGAAAQSARISPSTLNTWLRKGDEGEEPFAAFAQRVLAAEAEGFQKQLNVIEKASAKDWGAAKWLCERLYAHFFSAPAAVEAPTVDPQATEKLFARLEMLDKAKAGNQ
jgi:transposase